ncbi:MAC/perforin domain-containing protein [Sphingobacterium sp. G1-14]|uniref:MAC/perforin domain-containing protein n=1 Tax=Sphingobacterium sp. G1-14 TaxID=2003121 RepID=UPI000B490DEC|nr:MAC/perforin domain-containing protein [Sphingobacterium sp. G1-14]
MKRINLFCTLIASTFLLANCAKNESNDEILLNNNSANKAFAGDEKWDVLGYGYDVAGDYLNLNSVKTLPVIDVDKFDAANNGKIYMPTSTSSPKGDYYFGSTATEFIKEINTNRKFDASASYGSKDSLKTGGQLFTASFSRDKSNESIKNTASRYSYARYDESLTIKRIQFTDDIDVDILKNYTTNDFKTYINTKSPEEIIRLYGTHVLLNVDLGGRLSFSFSANITSETSQEKKINKVQGGLGFFIKSFGINIGGSKNTEEMTKDFNESRERSLNLSFYGGTNSGRSITFDSNGNSSESINIASWQQSISSKNCALTNIRKMVPLYHFVTDPTKKAALKVAIEKYISDNQISELGEIPVYSLLIGSGKFTNHLISHSPSSEIGDIVNEGVVFYALKNQKPGTVPVYRYRNDKYHNNFYTVSGANLNLPDYKYEGIVYYAYPSPGSSLKPVFRYYNENLVDHYYTMQLGTYMGYKFERIEFYGIGID